MKLLLHVCCALCYAKALPGLDALRRTLGGALDVTAFWYNPNIHPLIEYRRRMKSVQVLSERLPYPLLRQDDYGLREFTRRTAAAQDAPARCAVCYDLRFTETARRAAAEGFDAFATTLAVSPHQPHDLIRARAEAAAQAAGIAFHYADWRACEPDEKLLAGIYRQQYCGCIFSEEDRYRPTSQHLYPPSSEQGQG